MKLPNLLFIFVFLLPLLGNSQFPIDTMEMNMDNIHVKEFAGTWYDNMSEKPVLRGFTLSRTRKDSSRFSITFVADGNVKSLHYEDSIQIQQTNKWWYDGTSFYSKDPVDTYYKKYKVFKDKDGDIIIAFRPSGWVVLMDFNLLPGCPPNPGRKFKL